MAPSLLPSPVEGDLLRLLLQLSDKYLRLLWNLTHRIFFDADVEIDHWQIFFQHALWHAAISDLGDTVTDHFSQQEDRPVAEARVLKSAIDDWPLALHHCLVFQRHDAANLAVKTPVVRFSLPLFSLIQKRAVISALLWFFGINREPHFLAVRIIDRDDPDRLLERYLRLAGIFRSELAGFAVDSREHRAPFPQGDMIWFCARLEDVQLNTVFALHGLKVGTLVVDIVEISQVRGIGRILHTLEPVAVVGFAGLAVSPF